MIEYFWYILASVLAGAGTGLVGIVGMCTLGSFAAWKAGNVVLGGFTLILTLSRRH